MMNQDQKALDDAIAAIRALCAGKPVPVAPNYYSGKGDVADLMFGAAWVAHALFAPDYEGSSVIETIFWETAREKAVKLPTHNIIQDEGPVDLTDVDAKGISEAITSVFGVLAAAPPFGAGASERVPFEGMRRRTDPAFGEDIIEQMREILSRRGGRLSGESGDDWPAPVRAHVIEARMIMSDLVSTISGGAMSAICVSKRDNHTFRPYPVSQEDVSAHEREKAAGCLGTLSATLDAVRSAYMQEAMTLRARQEAVRKREQSLADAEAARIEILERHGAALEAADGQAETEILRVLREGGSFPVFRGAGSNEKAQARRDAVIDALDVFLGPDRKAVTQGFLHDPRRGEAMGLLKMKLDEIYLETGPSPE